MMKNRMVEEMGQAARQWLTVYAGVKASAALGDTLLSELEHQEVTYENDQMGRVGNGVYF